MQLDDVQLVVRERSYLETLDLAVLLVRRHWRNLAVAAAVGVGPFAVLNAILFRDRFDAEFAMYALVVVMELPWATAPLTLYLGIATFSERVRWREVAAAWWRSLPQMVVFQLIIRGVLVATSCLVLPLLFLALWGKFLNEMVLLERSGMKRLFQRWLRFHNDLLGETLGYGVADAFFGGLMVVAFTAALGTATELVRRPVWTDYRGADPLESLGELISWSTWEGQLVLWAVLCFFTVVRYLLYLNLRIRREGWEVELKLRAQGQRFAEDRY